MSKHEPTQDGQPPRRVHFDTTRWSVIVAAGGQQTTEGQAAMEDLCERYWYPLYAYVRRRQPDLHEAQDLTQAFFAKLLEKNYVAQADPERGRFRTFLLAALNHFLANEWDKARAEKRGSGRQLASLDLSEGEERFRSAASDSLTAEKLFEREWAMTLLREVLDQLREEYQTAKRGELFSKLEPALTMDPPQGYKELAAEMGSTPGAVKVAVHRLRKRYRDLIRAEIAQTLTDPGGADEEIQRLFETFA